MLGTAPKAIETTYRGRQCRSRLEARWAVVFDALLRGWDYEPAGYELPCGQYLPDYWLPIQHHRWCGAGYWVEVKIREVAALEKRRCWQLARLTGHKVFMLAGYPEHAGFDVYRWRPTDSTPDVPPLPPASPWESLLWAYRRTGAEVLTSPATVETALKLASTARFEHGDGPVTEDVQWRAEQLLTRLRSAGFDVINQAGSVWVPRAGSVPGLYSLIRTYSAALLPML